MASIRQIAQDVLYEARDGIAWIALYKEGRSWNAECFWGLFDKQEVFTTDYPEDSERLREILSIDPNAIFVNAYLHNLGPIDDEMTRDNWPGPSAGSMTCNISDWQILQSNPPMNRDLTIRSRMTADPQLCRTQSRLLLNSSDIASAAFRAASFSGTTQALPLFLINR